MINLKVGDVIDVTIDDFGSEGEGIAHLDGSTVFVGGGIKGEKIKARVTHFNARKGLVFAKTAQILKASPSRVAPLCPVHSACGGCTMQHISYAEQLNVKRAQIKNCLAKYARIEIENLEIEPSDKQFGYRNKLQLPVREEKGEIKIGFFRENTHFIVPITSCHLHENWAEKLISAVKNYMIDKGISAYNEDTNTGLIRHIVARKFSEILSIIIVVNGKNLPYAANLIKKLQDVFGTKFTIALSENTYRTNLIICSDTLTTLFGAEEISENYNGLKVRFSPLAFLQINNYIAGKIYDKVAQLIPPNSTVIDAYSGIGIMTAMIAKRAKMAYGIEIVQAAVQSADRLKTDNKITNMRNILGDVAVELPKLAGDLPALSTNDLTIVLDPPRKGCEAVVMNIIRELQPAQIIYVSCNPSTLARDIATLNGAVNKNVLASENKIEQSAALSEASLKNDTKITSILENNHPVYEVSFIKGYDMFPNSAHIECLVCLSRKA